MVQTRDAAPVYAGSACRFNKSAEFGCNRAAPILSPQRRVDERMPHSGVRFTRVFAMIDFRATF